MHASYIYTYLYDVYTFNRRYHVTYITYPIFASGSATWGRKVNASAFIGYAKAAPGNIAFPQMGTPK